MSLDQDDNIIVGAGTGGSTQGANVATDYNSSSESHYQLFKQTFGKDGDFTAVGDGSDAGSRPLPVKLFQQNGVVLSANELATGLSVLNVNLRGTSGSGNVPVDINAQTLGVIRVEGKTGGTPMGVCGDNFQIRTLVGATAGNTLSVFGINTGNDSVAVQGMSGGHPVGITVDSPLDIRALTSNDQITVAGTVTVSPGAGFSLDGGTITVHGGATAYGDATSPMGASLAASGVGSSAGLPVLLYGNSGGTPTAVGMSGDALRVVLGQTISASLGDVTIDGSAPKATDYDSSGRLDVASSHAGNTLATPVLLYGQSGGNSDVARALTVTGGGALLTEIQGSITATIGDISVDIPKAIGYTSGSGLLLSSGDVTGNTMATPVLLYGASGNTAVGIGITQSGTEQALLVHGDMKVHNSAGTELAITLGSSQPLDVTVKSIPVVTIGTVTPTVTISPVGAGITIAGGTLDSILRTVTVVGAGFTLAGGVIDTATVVGGVTGFGIGAGPGLAASPGVTKGLPVFLYGNSGGTAAAVGMSGDGIKVFHESLIDVKGIADTVTTAGGVTGYGHSELTVAPAGERGIATLLYGNSGGTASAIGMSGDGIKVSVIDGVNLTVNAGDVNISDIEVENKAGTLLAVGLSGDTLVPAGATFHDGTVLNVNTHFFGLTGGLHNSFGLTAGGTYGSSIMVTGFSGPGTAVQTQDQFLADNIAGFTNDILKAFYAGEFDPVNPGESVSDIVLRADDRLLNISETASNISTTANSIEGDTESIDSNLTSLITGIGEFDFNGQSIELANEQLLRVDVNGIKLPNVSVTDNVGNTAGLLPDIGLGNQETGTQLSDHTLLRGVNIKNTSGTGIIHVAFSETDAAAGSAYKLHSMEEVFIETSNLENLWVASCPGASGCYIGG